MVPVIRYNMLAKSLISSAAFKIHYCAEPRGPAISKCNGNPSPESCSILQLNNIMNRLLQNVQVSVNLKLGVMYDHNGTYIQGIGVSMFGHKIVVKLGEKDKLQGACPIHTSFLHATLNDTPWPLYAALLCTSKPSAPCLADLPTTMVVGRMEVMLWGGCERDRHMVD